MDKIGEGLRVRQFCVILPDVEIGSNCNVCAHAWMEDGVKVRDNITLKSSVHLCTGLIVEDSVFIVANVTGLCDIPIGESVMIGKAPIVTKDVLVNAGWYGNHAKLKGYK